MVAAAQQRRILVVDDDRLLRRALCRMLARRYDVVDAESCEAALLQLATPGATIALVVLDIQFSPGQMQGTQALVLIRHRWPKVGVIMLSVHHDVALALQFGSLGVRDYLSKTDNLHTILEPAVERALAEAVASPLAMTPPPIRPFEDLRRATFVRAFHACGGNMSAAARQLDVPYDAYRHALIEWGVVRPRTRRG